MAQFIQPPNPALMAELLRAEKEKMAARESRTDKMVDAIVGGINQMFSDKEKKLAEQKANKLREMTNFAEFIQKFQGAEMESVKPPVGPPGPPTPPAGYLAAQGTPLAEMAQQAGWGAIKPRNEKTMFTQEMSDFVKATYGINIPPGTDLGLVKTAITTSTKSDDSVSEEMAAYWGPKLGIEPARAKEMSKKDLYRMAQYKMSKPTSTFEVIYNEMGIPTSVQGIDSSGKPFLTPVAENKKASEMLVSLQQAEALSKEIFDLAMELGPSNKAWVQRAKGLTLEAANKLGLGGELGQKVGILDAKAKALSSILSKGVLRETGVLTDQDVQRALNLLGKPTHTDYELAMLEKGFNKIVELSQGAIRQQLVPVFGQGRKAPTPAPGPAKPPAKEENVIDAW